MSAATSSSTIGYVQKTNSTSSSYRLGATLNEATQFILDSTLLSRYQIYDQNGYVLGFNRILGSLISRRHPADDTEWLLTNSGNGFQIKSLNSTKFIRVKEGSNVELVLGAVGTVFILEPAQSCFSVPEAMVGISGTASPILTETGKIIGVLDMHMHLGAAVAFGGTLRCGKPFHFGGFAEAMNGTCKSFGPLGISTLIENAIGGSGSKPLVRGFPTFEDWPNANTVLHEQAYYKSLERSFKAGVRAVKVLLVANRVLCEAFPVCVIRI
jgi:hypothetical protein